MIEVRQEIKNNGICEFLAGIENEVNRTGKILTLDFVSEGKRARTFTEHNGKVGITKGWEIDREGNLVKEIGDKIAISLWFIDGTKTES